MTIERTCPLGHTCERCLWHTKLRGVNPNTGQEIDEEGCAVVWLPVLLIEQTREQVKATNTVGDFRDRMVRGNQEIAGALLGGNGGAPQALDWDSAEILP